LSAHAATHTPRIAHAQPKSVIFKASFQKKGLKGWIRGNAGDWHVTSKGVVAFKGSQDELLAPISTAKVHDFAVQASIKPVGAPSQPSSGFGVVVRAENPVSGITGGSVYSNNLNYNLPLLLWKNESVGGTNVTLKPGFNTYRLEVHGADYTLSINGAPVVSFTIADFSDGGSYPLVGVWGVNQKLQVKSLVVTRLGTATPLPALPPVRTINLAPADVPSILQPVGNSYFTDSELALIDKVGMDTITSTGLLVTYQANYAVTSFPTSGAYGVFSYVYAYSSRQMAQNEFSIDWSRFQARWAQNTNYSTNVVSGVGDDAHMLTYEYTETGASSQIKGTLVGIFFRRGIYEVTLFEDFVQGTVAPADTIAQATSLAKIVDDHILMAG
jgi:hypothetical protein